MMARMTIVTGLLAALLMAGCAANRPVTKIREKGDFHYGRAEYDMAAAEYQQIVDRYPGGWYGQYMLGRAQLELGNLREARRSLEIAHDEKPKKDEIAHALAEVMFQQGDESHLFAFLRERAVSSQSVHDYLQLARYSARLNDPDSAHVAVITAIEIDDGESTTPYMLAAALAEDRGNLDQAVQRLRQAYGIDPYDQHVSTRLRALGEVPGPTIALPSGR